MSIVSIDRRGHGPDHVEYRHDQFSAVAACQPGATVYRSSLYGIAQQQRQRSHSGGEHEFLNLLGSLAMIVGASRGRCW
jgi:hypothetical protein